MYFKKTQTLAEYAILISVVVGTMIAMQTYVKRGLQARCKTFVDGAAVHFTDSETGRVIKQYEPYYTYGGETKITNQDNSEIQIGNDPGGGRRIAITTETSGNSSRQILGASEEALAREDQWEVPR